MKTKPFCLAVSKDWTLQPRKLDLNEIYTKLVWKKKHRKAYTVEKEDLEDITKILSEEKLEDEGPVRILVQGNFVSRMIMAHTRQATTKRKRERDFA